MMYLIDIQNYKEIVWLCPTIIRQFYELFVSLMRVIRFRFPLQKALLCHVLTLVGDQESRE